MTENKDCHTCPESYPSYINTESCNAKLVISHEIIKRPSLDDFSDIFSKKEIKIDKKSVEDLKCIFKKEEEDKTDIEILKITNGKSRSEAMEIIIGDQIELNDWFGPDALFTRTTEYDDFYNGVDAVAEFNIESKKPQRLALAIDVTMRAESEKVASKIERNISKMLNNRLQVKYFESQIDGFKGKIKDVVPVVIGIEGRDANELIKEFSEIIKVRDKTTKTDMDEKVIAIRKKNLANHPVQVIFLEEISEQLVMYHQILKSQNNDNINVKSEQIQETILLINDIIKEKKDIYLHPRMKLLKNDGIYNLIQYFTKKNIDSLPKKD